MTLKICLRCDWQGETTRPVCPTCGQRPLYVTGAAPFRESRMPPADRPEEPFRDVVSTAGMTPAHIPPPRSEPPPTPREAVEPSRRSTRSVVTFVTTALVLAVIVGTWLESHEEGTIRAGVSTGAATLELPPDERSPDVSTEKTDVDTARMVAIAKRFMKARNAHDTDKAMSLLADDGVRMRLMDDHTMAPYMGSMPLTQQELARALEAERIYGVRYRNFGCRWDRDPVVGPAQVTCSYRLDDRLRRISGLPPRESSFEIGIRNGRVDRLTFPWLSGGFPSNVPREFWEFERWLEAEHPEAGGPMDDGTLFETRGQELVLILTRESVDRLASYLDEYEG